MVTSEYACSDNYLYSDGWTEGEHEALISLWKYIYPYLSTIVNPGFNGTIEGCLVILGYQCNQQR